MADLLEALLQIKALAGTPARVGRVLHTTGPDRWTVRRLPAERTPAEILAHLADAEVVFCRSVRLVLTDERPRLPAIEPRTRADAPHHPAWDPATALETFAARRGETVELLSSCSAAQLERVGMHPVRRLITVADLVAIMLAHDTDHVGQILDQLGPGRSPESPPTGP